jgi:uncharacterized protein YwgA
MNRLQRAAIIVSLIKAMRAKDSWCGETNVQKGCYFLQELARVPLDLEFVLYKYGPYSFELTDELTAMRADSILSLRVRDPKYGPSYFPGELADPLLEQYPKTVRRYKQEVDFVAERLGSRGIAELERLATALYVRSEGTTADLDARVGKIVELKPHISRKDAKTAIREVDEMVAEMENSHDD